MKAKKTEKVECNDKKCPVHGNVTLRGNDFVGTIKTKDAHRTAVIEFSRLYYIKKFERYEKRKTKIKVHNPSCINAQINDNVKVVECRPLSKTKKFVITEVIKQ